MDRRLGEYTQSGSKREKRREREEPVSQTPAAKGHLVLSSLCSVARQDAWDVDSERKSFNLAKLGRLFAHRRQFSRDPFFLPVLQQRETMWKEAASTSLVCVLYAPPDLFSICLDECSAALPHYVEYTLFLEQSFVCFVRSVQSAIYFLLSWEWWMHQCILQLTTRIIKFYNIE
jgi:hypothetical protein